MVVVERARRSLFTFPNAEAELAKSLATQDWIPILQAAFSSGEPLFIPAHDYNLRSKTTAGNGVQIDADVDIDVECAKGARFIPAASAFTGVSGSVFALKAATLPQAGTEPAASLRWIGGHFDGGPITTANGAAVTFGINFLDLTWYQGCEVSGVLFFGGLTTPSGSGVGSGYIDSAINTHACTGERYFNNIFIGLADLAIYLSGSRRRIALANALGTAAGSNVVAATWPSHGLATGAKLGIEATASVGGLTAAQLSTQFVITVTGADTFTLVAPANATSTVAAGGGTVTFYDPISGTFDLGISGTDALVVGNRGYRCGNFLSQKRSHVGAHVIGGVIDSCSNGVRQTSVDDPIDEGKRLIVEKVRFRNIVGRPIVFVGGWGAKALYNEIENFGKWLSDGGQTFTGVSAGNNVAAIGFESCQDFHAVGNVIRNSGAYAVLSASLSADQEPIGIHVKQNAKYLDVSADGVIADNVIRNVNRPLRTMAGSRRTVIRDNVMTGFAHPALLQGDGERAGKTWTPSLAFGGGAPTALTYDLRSGDYQVANGVVTGSGYIDVGLLSGASGETRIAGFPFVNGAESAVVEIIPQFVTVTGQIKGLISPGQDYAVLYASNDGALAGLSPSAIGASSRMRFTFAYPIAA